MHVKPFLREKAPFLVPILFTIVLVVVAHTSIDEADRQALADANRDTVTPCYTYCGGWEGLLVPIAITFGTAICVVAVSRLGQRINH